MHSSSSYPRRLARPAALLAALSALGLSLTLLVTPALATHVEPIPINSGNPTCSDFDDTYGGGSTWTEFKLEEGNLSNGAKSDGTLTVTISNLTNTSFDWSSNIGVDAVFVKAGTDKHNLYVYDPESTGDTGLQSQAGQGNGISHISFCYDLGDATPTPTPTESPTPTPTPTASPTPTPTPTPEESEQGSTPTPTPTPTLTPTPTPEESEQGSTPTPTPEGSVLGGTGTPAPSLPDGAMGANGGPSPVPTVIFGLILLASLATLAWVNVQAVRSRA